MDTNIKGKRVLVTGGSSGLGAAIAKAFAAEGARIAINYINGNEATDAFIKEFDTCDTKALGVVADISDPAAVDTMFGVIDEQWGGIDVLINNAGIDGLPAFGWQGETGDWSRVVDVNLKGTFYCARQALQRMISQKSGVIINTSSVHEVIAWSGYSAYCASKAGISMMSRTLAQEAAPHGVRVLCIAPGAIRTPINKQVWNDPENYRDLLSKIPLGRIGEPEDIAHIAVVLASDIAGYVTGTTVFVDGGMTDYPSFAHGG